jgi:DNA-binding YbaB/EbfC family protein
MTVMPPEDDDRELLAELVEDDELVEDGQLVDDGDESANPFAGIDLNALMQQAQSLQSQLVSAQQAAASQIIEGRAGGGQVTVTMTGEGEPLAVHVNPSVIDPDERELLEDLLLAAFKDAVAQAQELSRSALGGLGDLLGGSA